MANQLRAVIGIIAGLIVVVVGTIALPCCFPAYLLGGIAVMKAIAK